MVITRADRRIRIAAITVGVILFLALLVVGCSKQKAVPTLPEAHPTTWMEITSLDFHGNVVTATGAQSCTVCHGSDWRGGKVGVSCIDCHLASGTACIRCHGGLDNNTGAPPYGLSGPNDDTSAAIGAHTAHMEGDSFSDGVTCDACHRVPAFVLDSLHVLEPGGGTDSIAEITWHGFADSLGGASWNRATRECSNTYCHGNFTGGDSTNVPGWNDASVACGSCHSVTTDPASLGWKHEFHIAWASLKCGDCHATVVDTLDQIIGLDLHVNGVVDTLRRDSTVCDACHGAGPVACVTCHGGTDNTTGAPPVGLRGETLTTQRAVGAHTAHVEDGTVADAFDCTECHIKPSSLMDAGHLGADSIAEITWGGIAPATGIAWDRGSETCANTYCHGNFPGGITANTPQWTGADQAFCGSCHRVIHFPEDLLWKHNYHVRSIGLECADCHASVVDLSLNIVGIDLHVNGVADTLTRDPSICAACHGPAPASCVTCHGGTDNATGAPPAGLQGETATTTRAVGAHSSHVESGPFADAFDCIECHIKPDSLLAPGHLGADSVAEVVWGGIAPATNATWHPSTTTCTDTYCHGNFLGGEGANVPDWTAANQALCGSCHDVGSSPERLSGRHSKHVASENIPCIRCHAATVDSSLTIVGPVLHVNGTKDVVFSTGNGTWDGKSCTGIGCHGREDWY